jgi:hypothetical protein
MKDKLLVVPTFFAASYSGSCIDEKTRIIT